MPGFGQFFTPYFGLCSPFLPRFPLSFLSSLCTAYPVCEVNSGIVLIPKDQSLKMIVMAPWENMRSTGQRSA